MIYNKTNIFYNSIVFEDKDIHISTQNIFDQSTQTFIQNRTFKYYNLNDMISEKRVQMVNRIFFLGEFSLLLEKCGFKIQEIFGDYNFGKFGSKSKNLIVVAKLRKK